MPETLTEHLAARADTDVLVVTRDHELTVATCRAGTGAIAERLIDLGVRPGDRVAVLQPLGVDALLLWWALDRIGAVYLPINPTWTARLAGRVVRERSPRLLLADPSMRALAAASAGNLPVLDPPSPHRSDCAVVPAVPRDPFSDCAIVHNSGLPGIHHGVRATPRSMSTMAIAMAASHPGDRILVTASTCFLGTLVTVLGAIAGGGSVALLPGLDAETFWPAIRRAGVTFAALLNPTLGDLLARPASPDDASHGLRLVTADPARAELNQAASARFGVHWIAGLAKTEVCGAVGTGLDPGPEEGLGEVRRPFIGRMVDESGADIPTGAAGELVLRCEIEGGLTPGYADDPAATAVLWRDGWMRTGWHLRQDERGALHPVGTMSVHPIVVKRAGYLFVADLEAEIIAVGTGVEGACVATRPGEPDDADPYVVAWVTGPVERDALAASLAAGLPAHLVPDVVVAVERLPDKRDATELADNAWYLRRS
jgi:crotonobetaine/carnitine-CoA ligase